MTGKPRAFYRAVGLISLLAGASAIGARQADEETTRSAPEMAEQQKLLSSMRHYAERYVSNLPNFLCIQVTEQFHAGKSTAHWHRGDTLTAKLVFNQGREERSLELVNDRPVKSGGRQWRTPLTTEGEFGMLLDSILGPASAATFSWRGWDTVRGRRVAVFDYSIDQEHSTLSLSLSDLAHAVVPYRGTLYADPANGAIWRITNIVTDIPPSVETKSISTAIEYEETSIGSATYLLPAKASIMLFTGSSNIRNEIEFKNYRKFEADSTITFKSDAPDGGTPARKPNLVDVPPRK